MASCSSSPCYRGGAEGPFAAAGRGLFAVVSPMQEAVSNVVRPVGDWISGIFHVGSLRAENERLEEQLRLLQQDSASVVAYQREIAELQELLDVQRASSVPTVAATVIGASVGNFEWTVTIDVGSSDGVAMNMAVRNADGLVGHVVQVSSLWSEVHGSSTPGRRGRRLARSGETDCGGSATGRPGPGGNATGCNADEQSDLVISGRLYPSRILIGGGAVYEGPGSLSKQLSIRPAVDFSSLQYVLVLLGSPVGAPG